MSIWCMGNSPSLYTYKTCNSSLRETVVVNDPFQSHIHVLYYLLLKGIKSLAYGRHSDTFVRKWFIVFKFNSVKPFLNCIYYWCISCWQINKLRQSIILIQDPNRCTSVCLRNGKVFWCFQWQKMCLGL